ncbi:hypothetical protein ACFXKC_08525 [Streptomyces sp. NPDC059340]|uniref:hypothetical protein n=1 Tax=Streptomyces sp. NPDC059340 TaxID=3346806 RepID=UPI003678BF74
MRSVVDRRKRRKSKLLRAPAAARLPDAGNVPLGGQPVRGTARRRSRTHNRRIQPVP